MSFDWQSFATGFLERTAENIKESKGEAKAFEERQRALAERNAQNISRRRAVANQVVGVTRMLRDNGASDTVIQAAISSKPDAIFELANKVEEASRKQGRKLSSSDIEALINIPEGFSSIDMDTEAFIEKTYGLGYEGKGVTTDMPERTFMDRLTGRKQMDMARARLDREVMQEGLTAYDINQMAAQQEYESLVPGTFVSFADAKVFDPAKDMLDFTRTFSSLLNDVQSSSAYEEVTRLIQNTQMNTKLSDEDKAQKLSSLMQQRDELILRSAGPTIESYVATYGDSFTDAATGFLRGYLSDSYVDSLTIEPEEADDDPLTATVVDISELSDEFSSAAKAADQTEEVLGGSFPEVEVSVLQDDVNRDEVTSARPKLRPASIEEAVEGGTEDPDGITFAEWSNMSRKERKDKGYPVSKIGGEMHFKRFSVGLGTVDEDQKFGPKEASEPEEPQETVKSVRERAAERFGIPPEKFDSAIDSGVLTELDLAIFADYSDDIMDFIKEKEYEQSREGVLVAITDWAEENRKMLPMDKNFLIDTFLSALEGS
jgi:hypothetical protein